MSILYKLRVIFPRRVKVQLIVLLLAIIVGALLDTFALSIISPFISVLLDSSVVSSTPALSFVYTFLGFQGTHGFLAFLAFVLAFVYAIRGIYLFFLNKFQCGFLTMQRIQVSDRLLSTILQKPYSFHTDRNLADLTRVVLSDTTSLFSMIQSVLLLLADFLMTFFMVVYLLAVSPAMTLVVLTLASICIFFYLYFFRRRLRDAGIENRTKEIAMMKAVHQALGGIKELKILRRESHFIEAFRQGSEGFAHSNQKYQVYVSLPRLFIESVCFSGIFILIGALIGFGADMESLVPQISVFVLAAFRMLPAMSRMTGYMSTILFNRVSVDSVYTYITEEEDVDGVRTETGCPDKEQSKDIVVQNITFQYPRTHVSVLKNVFLRVPHMQSVAFIGPSGAGKTTLADIILGIYNPTSGTVCYEGYNIHENMEEWIKNVGYIPQQIYLLDDTVINNVAFGIPEGEISLELVWRALEQAQLKDYVLSLPDGLDTVVGDQGVRLSGGQRQRIGIARALYHNPPILILDEATSSLDTETEAAVMDAINSFRGTKTMIIIAHRLSTIERCDIIYRVQDGKVVQEK